VSNLFANYISFAFPYWLIGEEGIVRSVGFALVGLVLVTSASAAGVPRCTVGLHVDDAGNTNEPGVIIQADDRQGTYKVRYDNSTTEEWVPSFMMDSCEGTPSGAKNLGFYYGHWDDAHQRGEPDLVIESNGTYAWLVNIDTGEIIRGNWHRADATQVDHNAVGPAIVLEEALYGKDWVAESLGEVDPNDREQILLQDDARDYAYFFRSKA